MEFKDLWSPKFLVRAVIVVALASIILTVFGYIFSAISGSWAVTFNLIIAAVLMLFAMKFRPGVENFLKSLPMVLLLTAISSIAVTWLPWMAYGVSFENLTVLGVLSGIALLLSAYYFADGLFMKYIAKYIPLKR